MAKSSSVVEGLSETMRRGGDAMTIVSPKSSVARVEDDEVGMRGEDCFDVRAQTRAEIGQRARGLGPLIVRRASDHSRAGANGEEQLGGGGIERDDAARWRRDDYRVAEVVSRARRG